MIIKALESQLDSVRAITQQTISEIYPKYYAVGAVDFFKSHHCDDNIMEDIKKGIVYLLEDSGEYVGTVTIKNNEICRLFVLPQKQHSGYGQSLLDFSEKKIFEKYSKIILDASLPAKRIYIKRGYRDVNYNQIPTDNGDILCYDVMEKIVTKNNTAIDYDGKIFSPVVNTANGEVGYNTIFNYHQDGFDFRADYMGGDIKFGFMVGHVHQNGELDFYYEHINIRNEIRVGTCHSIPQINDNGKIELHEEWQWINGDCSTGSSIVVER